MASSRKMELRILQTFMFLSLTVSYAEALYKPGNFLLIVISVILPAAVLISFCGVVVFLCKNRKRIPILRSKFGTTGHEKLSQGSSPAPAPAPAPMPPPQSPSAPPAEKTDDVVQPLQQ